MLEEGTSKGSKKNQGEGAEAIRRVVSGSQRRRDSRRRAVWRSKTGHFIW